MTSEISQLHERLRKEAEAAFQAVHGYSVAATHLIIRKRVERSEQTFAEIVPYIGEDAAEEILAEAMETAAKREEDRKKRRAAHRKKRKNKKGNI